MLHYICVFMFMVLHLWFCMAVDWRLECATRVGGVVGSTMKIVSSGDRKSILPQFAPELKDSLLTTALRN